MARGGYGQFCPVAMASEVLCSRWTMLVVRELVCGSKRFNELRRGLQRMSPALLSQRLKELEEAGIVRRVAWRDEPGIFEYHLTRAGRELEPIIMAMGFWGKKWVETQATLQNLDATLLMWDMHRRIDPTALPPRRCVIQFLYPELPPARRNYWLIISAEGEVDLCCLDPGFEIDLYVDVELRTMTAVWMGIVSLDQALRDGKLTMTGDPRISARIKDWLGLSVFAGEKEAVNA
jgi:DNA-binding HxlR family transcriptional regulator